MQSENYLKADELRRIWKEEFLPSIRQEIKLELQTLKASIDLLTDRCNTLENSQQFLSNKYDTVVQTLQNVKEQVTKLDKKYKDATGSLEAKQTNMADMADKTQETLYRIDCSLDETQQYLRRDCLEITGVPITSHVNPKLLVKEIGTLIGAEIDDSHIAAAHRLPDSKNVKNRLIVKFLQRDKREEVYKKRKHLVGKSVHQLPSIQAEIGESVSRDNKIYINESLTSYRKRLFGRIKDYKRKNNVKYLWTSNGKIMLKVNEASATEAFTTHEEFEDYLDQISNA